MARTLKNIWQFALVAATTTVTQAYLRPDMQVRLGVPPVNHLEVISTERTNSTVQEFLDTLLPVWGYEGHEGSFPGVGSLGNSEPLQKCINDPCAEGMFWWFSRKLKLQDMDATKDEDIEYEDCEILIKSVQFLEDGHVIFCLSSHENLKDLERKKERELMKTLMRCVKSHIGYIGGFGSPPVKSLVEFMVQVQEHAKYSLWTLRLGTYNGGEMTAREFLRQALTDYDEQHGEPSKGCRLGARATGIELQFHDNVYHFTYKQEHATGGGEYKYLSSVVDGEDE